MTGTVHGRLLVMCAGLLLGAGPAHAQMEGTLFTQPNEREFLDRLRRDFLANSQDAGFNVQEVVIPELAEEAAAAEAGPVTVTFGGIMNRRDGSHSIWLDGRLLTEAELPDGMSLVAGERSTSLRIVQDGNIFILRPGQAVNLDTGTIIENFQRPRPAPLVTEQPVAEEPAPEEIVAASPPAEVADVDKGEEETPDPVEPLAAAILQLTPEQETELVDRLNAAADESVDEDDGDDEDE